MFMLEELLRMSNMIVYEIDKIGEIGKIRRGVEGDI